MAMGGGSRPDRGGGLPDEEEIVGLGSDADVFDAELLDEDGEVTTEIIDGTAPEIDAVALAEVERDEYLDSLRRLQAEFENYKKRVAKQQADQASRAAASLVESLLPVLDALDLAAEHLGEPDSGDAKALVAASGLLHGVLAKEGLERIDPTGEPFDPTAHEAVGRVPADETVDQITEGSNGATAAATTAATTAGATAGEPQVARVMRAGYRWKGAVVRPAMVMVQG